MPQARSGGSRTSGSSSGTRRPRTTGAKTSRSSSTKSPRSSGSATRARASTSARSGAKKGASTSTKAGASDARFDAVAARVRKLNEQIIAASKEAGESTLDSYEKVLKTISSSIERGPGASDVEWISNLATAQAKFLRDVTAAWTKAARKMLK